MQQEFSGRMLNHKWTRTVRNVAVGDVVYLAEAENDDPTNRLGKIVEANPGEDGCVRTVRVQYTNPGKSGGTIRSLPKTTTRPIHKIAVMVPVGYTFKDDVCDNEVGSRGRKHDLGAIKAPGAAEAPGRDPTQAEVREPEAGGTQPAAFRSLEVYMHDRRHHLNESSSARLGGSQQLEILPSPNSKQTHNLGA
jgi:hypothetical protein